jgi:hypothetical protein
MDQKKYIRLQLVAIREYSIIIEKRLGKKIENNILLAHWCKRHAKHFRSYVSDYRLTE